MIEPKECITAILLGVRFDRPFFRIANYFNDILDSLTGIDTFQPNSFEQHKLSFGIGDISVSISHELIVVNSEISFDPKLIKIMQENKLGGEKIPIPNNLFETAHFGEFVSLEERKESPKRFRDSFIDESIETINLIDSLVEGGLPELKFAGLVEYYCIPLSEVKWDILEKFAEKAAIEGAENVEKIVYNKYHFFNKDQEVDNVLNFKLIKPNSLKEPKATVAGATFDYQIVPKEGTSLDGLGGTKEVVKSLAKGVGEKINLSEFLKFSTIDED